MKVKTNSLKLVDLRLYRKNFGVEVDENMPKAIVYLDNKDNNYHNIINTKETYPFLTRTPYTNTMNNGVVYGTKLFVQDPSQIEEIGICAIECQDDFMSNIYSQEYIDINDLKKKIIESTLYFKDRVEIIKELINDGYIKRKRRKLIERDFEKNFHYIEQLCKIEQYENKKLVK